MPVPATIGNTIAPPRFLAFLLLFAAASAVALRWWDWELALMAGFDVGAALFLVSCAPLFLHHSDQMRALAARNDANRTVMLLVSGLVATVILVAVAVELSTEFTLSTREKVGIAATLVLVWSFANAIWTLHYAHIFYTPGIDDRDCGGIDFPGTDKPDMADFAYFAFTIGVAVQTADVAITSRHVRRVVLIQSIAGFFFNLFVLALSINVLGAR
ncbi:DUF1345 domain-containing protein [Sphingomonas sp. LY29]|uniref:DUF1345 domain-containing protein n=1 Tax=Sphingomonas sp. LY29 TaxID=3095341 RepID=UPI002D77E59A|nr:DUF1345 domain-containing protein [Sphingomonas sp. LY29]WRP25019.1 DUF1345 domain-containing protein [Sphingomonas sp. LY29]